MKFSLRILPILAFILVMGCKPSGQQTAEPAAAKASSTLEQTQAATKEAAQQLRDYTFEQKTEFIAAMKKSLAEVNQKVDDFSAKIEKASDATREEAKPKLDALREQAAKLNKQLDEVSNASASTWSTIKADTEKAAAGLEDAERQSRQWLSDKIAP